MMTDETLTGAWSTAIPGRGPVFTMDKLNALFEKLRDRPAQPETIIVGPPPRGTNQRARRQRLVMLENGARLELPDGMHPALFLLSGPEGRAQMLAQYLRPSHSEHMLIFDEASLIDFDDLSPLPAATFFGMPIHTSRKVPPGTVFIVPQPDTLPRWRV